MGKVRTILVIDDSNTSLLLLEWALKKEGHNVLLASSVTEARKLIEAGKPDLILLDLFMPDVTGYEFLKMKSELNIEDIPVIIVSAYDSQESVKQTKELGATKFIAKPFNMEEIVKTVQNLIA